MTQHHDAMPLTAQRLRALAPGLLRQRTYRLLWLAGLTSAMAQGMLVLAVLVLVHQRTASAASLGAAVVAMLLAVVTFRLPADGLVDGAERGAWLVAGYALSAALAFVLVLLREQAAPFYAVVLVLSALAQVLRRQAAAAAAVVEQGDRSAGADLFSLTTTAGYVLGLFIVAPLLARVVGGAGLCAAAGLLLVLAGLLAALLRPYLVQQDTPLHIQPRALAAIAWNEITEALRVARRDWRVERSLSCLAMVVALAAMLAVMGPVFSVSVLHIAAGDSAFLLAPSVLGGFLAVGAMDSLVRRFGLARLMVGSLVAVGGLLVLLGAAKTGGNYIIHNLLGRVIDTRRAVVEIIPLVLLLAGALGFACTALWNAASRMLRESWPDRLNDRLPALTVTLAAAGALLPAALVGGGVEVLGVNKTIVLLGLTWLGAGTIALRLWLPGDAGDG